jgi:hypothetical protein
MGWPGYPVHIGFVNRFRALADLYLESVTFYAEALKYSDSYPYLFSMFREDRLLFRRQTE